MTQDVEDWGKIVHKHHRKIFGDDLQSESFFLFVGCRAVDARQQVGFYDVDMDLMIAAFCFGWRLRIEHNFASVVGLAIRR